MTDWKARIAALPPIPSMSMCGTVADFWTQRGTALQAHLDLAAARAKVPHEWNCHPVHDLNTARIISCTCGLYDDLLAILRIDP